MAIITLSSDHGHEMWMHTPLKAAIRETLPQNTLVDFFHDVSPWQIQRSAYRMLMSLGDFPKGTVHIVLNDVYKYDQDLIVAEFNTQYFIGANTGYYSLIGADPEKCMKVSVNGSLEQSICNAVQELTTNTDRFFSSLTKVEDLLIKNLAQPFVRENALTGEVLFTDHFGNAVLNIHKKDIANFCGDSPYSIVLNRFENIESISDKINSKEPGEMLARFNSAGFLMLCIVEGNAATLLNLHEGKAIRITKQ